MATAKDCHTLISYYKKVYKAKYGKDPVVNSHAARWGFDSVLMDVSMDDAKKLLDYYMTTASAKSHDLNSFLYNYDKLIVAIKSKEEDDKARKKLREESKIRAKEWRESGERRTLGN